MSLDYHVIPKEVENGIMDTIAFLDTNVCVNKTHIDKEVEW